jgi:hypothetical protein
MVGGVPSCILWTGATGAIGGALLAELLDWDNEVYCLVRPSKHGSAEARLRHVSSHPRAKPVTGDITKPLCGIDPARLPPIDKLVHAAADTRLNHASAPGVLEANLSGTKNILRLAEELGLPELTYVGTAYIAGDATILTEQGPGEPLTVGQSRNPNEASKVEAERAVRRYQGRFSVQRPSIVIGRSDDGSAVGLENWYGLFRGVWRLREMLRKGDHRDENGLRIGRGYRLHLPIALGEVDNIELNLIQLDWLSRTAASLIALPARGEDLQSESDPPTARSSQGSHSRKLRGPGHSQRHATRAVWGPRFPYRSR